MTSPRRLLASSTALAAVTVLLEIGYPLTADDQLGRLSVATVLVACVACVAHALALMGGRGTVAFVVLVLVAAFAVEAVGVSTGFPFGSYSYAHSLGPLLAGVPLLVPLAWLMMAYPCLVMANELAVRTVARQRLWLWSSTIATCGGLGLAAWDVFLDPQMVAAGHWSWRHPSPALPGVHGVPLTNLVGWLVSGTVLMALATLAVRRALGRAALRTRLQLATPTVLLTWTWLGGIVGNAVFFDRAAVAAWGGLLLGLVVVPYLLVVGPRWTA
jgi:uncharacterized membrane protein